MEGKHAVASAPIETKVKASTGAALLVGLAVAFLNWAQGDSQLMGSLPPWLQALAVLVVPPVVTFLSGWKASHTPRPDTVVLTPED
jgi:hypothetical protein